MANRHRGQGKCKDHLKCSIRDSLHTRQDEESTKCAVGAEAWESTGRWEGHPRPPQELRRCPAAVHTAPRCTHLAEMKTRVHQKTRTVMLIVALFYSEQPKAENPFKCLLILEWTHCDIFTKRKRYTSVRTTYYTTQQYGEKSHIHDVE